MAQPKALSWYIPRASGAASCSNKISTTLDKIDKMDKMDKIEKVDNMDKMDKVDKIKKKDKPDKVFSSSTKITLVCPAREAQTRAELPWTSLASTLVGRFHTPGRCIPDICHCFYTGKIFG